MFVSTSSTKPRAKLRVYIAVALIHRHASHDCHTSNALQIMGAWNPRYALNLGSVAPGQQAAYHATHVQFGGNRASSPKLSCGGAWFLSSLHHQEQAAEQAQGSPSLQDSVRPQVAL